MNDLNPELASQVAELARLVGRQLNRESFDLEAQAAPILQALMRGGYDRISANNLQTRVEQQVVAEFPEIAIHRRGELGGITGKLQSTFSQMVRWQTQRPNQANPPQAANLSAFTDS